ncbi:hypothetical protein B0H14DRAFT_3886312 [Mycena olivaceomarginata]|nr:hypothetical protein B0H14DRAFT_3886312 [Mycena olivaceomarginata]
MSTRQWPLDDKAMAPNGTSPSAPPSALPISRSAISAAPAEGLLRAIRIAAVHALRLRILESPNVWGGVMRLSPFCARLWLRACAGAHSLLPVPLDAPLKAFACSVGPTTRFDDVLHIQVVKCPYDDYNTPEKAHMAVALLSTRLSGALGCWPACLFDVRRNNLDLDLFEDDADVPPLFAVYFSFPLENIWTEHKIADQMRISLHHIWILDQVNGAIGANVPFPAASNYSLKPRDLALNQTISKPFLCNVPPLNHRPGNYRRCHL